MGVIVYEKIENLYYNEKNSFLEFEIIIYTKKPKIVRYVQRNYVRTPIYDGYSIRTKILKKFSKNIIPIRFVEQDILSLNLKKEHILKIIDLIGIIPQWRDKEIKVEKINQCVCNLKKEYRNYNKEKCKYNYKSTDFKETPDNFLLYFFLGFFCLFFNFFIFTSKSLATKNKNLNETNRIYNVNHKIDVDNINIKLKKEIEEHNNKLESKINDFEIKKQKILNKKIKLIKTDEYNWKNIKDSSIFGFQDVSNDKGVYIIWNKTKNKYYVGQSKNIKERLNQHFHLGEVKNIIFAKDWYENDQFYFSYFNCSTRDELDRLEKEYINKYFAFENGYNSTRGNN